MPPMPAKPKLPYAAPSTLDFRTFIGRGHQDPTIKQAPQLRKILSILRPENFFLAHAHFTILKVTVETMLPIIIVFC